MRIADIFFGLCKLEFISLFKCSVQHVKTYTDTLLYTMSLSYILKQLSKFNNVLIIERGSFRSAITSIIFF